MQQQAFYQAIPMAAAPQQQPMMAIPPAINNTPVYYTPQNPQIVYPAYPQTTPVLGVPLPPVSNPTQPIQDASSMKKDGFVRGLFQPKNKCLYDTNNNTYVGPSFMSTVILIIFFLRLLTDASNYFSFGIGMQVSHKVVVYGAIVLQCIAFYSYVLHYRKCNALFGWFVFILAAISTEFILQAMIAKRKEEMQRQQQQQQQQGNNNKEKEAKS